MTTFPRRTWVRQHQHSKSTILDINEVRDSGIAAASVDHMQIICISFQTDNHASGPSLNLFYRQDALPDT